VNATPVLSPLISDLTRELGVIVGKGPAVSVGVVEQVVELEPPVESVPVLVVSVSVELPEVSFLQALAKGIIAARPRAANPFFKKSFLSIMIDFIYAALINDSLTALLCKV
jgi:hypothetical protein